jgi:hypothetical protein
MPSGRQFRRPARRRGDDLGRLHLGIAEETPAGDLLRTSIAEPAHDRREAHDNTLQDLRPLFRRRSSLK